MVKEVNETMSFSNWKRTEKQPFYSVLTTQADSRYVAQENIELVAGKFPITFYLYKFQDLRK